MTGDSRSVTGLTTPTVPRGRTLLGMQSTRTSTSARRLGALVGPALIGAIVLSSCGGGETAATQSTIDLSAASTAFVVRPPATTVPTDTVDAGDPDADRRGHPGVRGAVGRRTLRAGHPFDVTLEDLLGVNEWTNAEPVPVPGHGHPDPAGWQVGRRVPGGEHRELRADRRHRLGRRQRSPTTKSEAAPTETIPDAGDNCAPGSYTIAETETTRTQGGREVRRHRRRARRCKCRAPPATARSIPASRSSSPPKPTADISRVLAHR